MPKPPKPSTAPEAIAFPKEAPFSIIDWVAVAMLILGMFFLIIPMVAPFVAPTQAAASNGSLHQLLNLFAFTVIECIGFVLLHARGRLPFLSPATLTSLISSTVGSIPKLLHETFRSKPYSKENHPNRRSDDV